MKHRSLGIFILLAASFAAIPQASQELAAFRDAVGERARIELWSAFLELQSGGARPAAAPAPAAIASCETPREETARETAKTTTPQSEESRREVKEQPRRADDAEMARIIVDPSDAPRWDPLESTCRHASLSIL